MPVAAWFDWLPCSQPQARTDFNLLYEKNGLAITASNISKSNRRFRIMPSFRPISYTKHAAQNFSK
jgi:hypothetical protein